MNSIIISGLPGAGKSSIGKILSERLNLEHYTTGELFKSIGKGTLTNETYYSDFMELCRKKDLSISFLNSTNDSEAAEAVWKSDLGKDKRFHEVLDEMQTALAKKGNIIIDGKLAIHMAGSHGFKIWIKASKEKRAQRIGSRDGLSREKSIEKLDLRDLTEREEWLRIYNLDILDQEEKSDLIIDTTDLSIEEAVELILKNLSLKLQRSPVN